MEIKETPKLYKHIYYARCYSKCTMKAFLRDVISELPWSEYKTEGDIPVDIDILIDASLLNTED